MPFESDFLVNCQAYSNLQERKSHYLHCVQPSLILLFPIGWQIYPYQTYCLTKKNARDQPCSLISFFLPLIQPVSPPNLAAIT